MEENKEIPKSVEQQQEIPKQEPVDKPKHNVAQNLQELWNYLRDITDIRRGADERGTVAGIKRDIDFTGPTSWILACSIFIASIGLNVNSTAVVIGAMLISPLMGPILGIGLSIGTNDFETLMRSLRNLLIAVGISVFTSTLYFAISPISTAQSELLSRTQPTLFDVFIAIFGGFAGIIAGSRKEKTNVTPGVAIATALMPPLCTAGYGLATLQWEFFFGAFYLFFINTVMIGASTIVVVRYLHFHRKTFVDPARERRVTMYIYIFLIITIIPSIFLGYRVVKKSIFQSKVESFVADKVSSIPSVNLLNYKSDQDSSYVKITLYGETLPQAQCQDLENEMQLGYGLEGVTLIVEQVSDMMTQIEAEMESKMQAMGANGLSSSREIAILQEVYERNKEVLKEKEQRITELMAEIEAYRRKQIAQVNIKQIAAEAATIYDGLLRIVYSEADLLRNENDSSFVQRMPYVIVKWDDKIRPSKQKKLDEKLAQWLRVRLELDTLIVAHHE